VRERLKAVPWLVPLVRAVRTGRARGKRLGEDARFHARRLRRDRQIQAYLSSHRVRKLQLGAGSNPHEGWLNTDVVDFRRRNEVIYLDARRPFPFPDGSFDAVFSEHMIEHLTYSDGLHCLRECNRILRSGGRIRTATPSLRMLAGLYERDLSELQQRYLAWSTSSFIGDATAPLAGFVLNNMFHNFEHRFVYDDETLRETLRLAGFVEIQEWAVGESGDPMFVGLERHMRSAAEFNAYETLVLEAQKP
jgi:predicted SAM-dependent methyltransferase